MNSVYEIDLSETSKLGNSFIGFDQEPIFNGFTAEGLKMVQEPNKECLKSVEKLDYVKEIYNFMGEQNNRADKESKSNKKEAETIRQLPKLESDCHGCYSYYYDESKNQIFSVNNIINEVMPVTYEIDKHLRELNNITQKLDSSKMLNILPWEGPVDTSMLTNLNEKSEYERIHCELKTKIIEESQ
jgi:hypothetical protein